MPLAVLKDYPIAVPYKGMNARKLFDEFIDKYGLKINPQELEEIYTLLKLGRQANGSQLWRIPLF